MDLSDLKSERISTDTVKGILYDFFSDFEEELNSGYVDQEDAELDAKLPDLDEYDDEDDDVDYYDESRMVKNIDREKFPYHARAICLYSVLLMTRLHEISPDLFEPYMDERMKDAKAQFRSKPEYANFSEKELEKVIMEITKKDIRNCFAHGCFEIGYVKHTEKLYFVLKPNRSGINSNNPIIINAKTLTKVLTQHLGKVAYRDNIYYQSPNFNPDDYISEGLMGFILPVHIMRFANYYFDPYKYPYNDEMSREMKYAYIQYALLSAKITYEQNEYYKYFGKDARLFKFIQLVRNSLAHGLTRYGENAEKVTHQDRDKNVTEDFAVILSKLITIDGEKMKYEFYKNNQSPEFIQTFLQMVEMVNDLMFDNIELPEDSDNVDSKKYDKDDPDDQPK